MISLDRRRLRTLAVATLVALGGAVLFGVLSIAFPSFGMPQPYYGFLYIPPQAWLLVLLAPTTGILALTTGITGVRQSQSARQLGWAGAFSALLLLLLLGPIYLICSFGAGWSVLPYLHALPIPQDLGWQADAWWWLTGGSIGVVLLTAVCALVYSGTARVPIGQPEWG
jgi:hypothetical protein